MNHIRLTLFIAFFAISVFGSSSDLKHSFLVDDCSSDSISGCNNFEFQLSSIVPKFLVFSQDTLVRIEDPDPSLELEGHIPIILIHGWNTDGRPAKPGSNQWTNIKDFILSDPTLRKNFKPYIVKYWSNVISVNQISGLLRDAMEQNGLHEQKVILIAHSMGGLVSRSYMSEQAVLSGRYANTLCGDQVKLLITLGTPHHGSPMANGPARDAKLNFLLRSILSYVDSEAFGDNKYNQLNRSDMLWDNYDGFYNLDRYTSERNFWLTGLNSNVLFDHKIICYGSWIQGTLMLPPYETTADRYKLGAYFQKEGLNYDNDGIVPYKSATFEGHTVKKIQKVTGYNHQEINTGKDGNSELVDKIKADLLPFCPLQITWPSAGEVYLKGGQFAQIQWIYPEDIQKVNLYYSIDGGVQYQLIASEIDASRSSYAWNIPEINALNVTFKLTNAVDESELALTKSNISIYHNLITSDVISERPYFELGHEEQIRWNQQGLGDSVHIQYIDLRNQVSIEITNKLATYSGDNQLSWTLPFDVVPTDSAVFEFELLGLGQMIGDYTKYIFRSNPFAVYGSPQLKIDFASSDKPDMFGIWGRKLVIDSVYSFAFEIEGAIEQLQVYLCDENQTQLIKLDTLDVRPTLHASGFMSWTAPQIRGDSFQLQVEAFNLQGEVVASTFADSLFRINSYPVLVSPQNQETDVALLPCFQFGSINQGAQYELELWKDGANDWSYYINTPSFCVPNMVQNELIPGADYNMKLWTLFPDGKSYGIVNHFSALGVKPDDFKIIKPTSFEVETNHLIDFSWERSVGAEQYDLEITQTGTLIKRIANLTKSDTLATVDLGDYWNSDTLKVVVAAKNYFGVTNAASCFFNTFKQGVIDLPGADSKPSFDLKGFPNPFRQGITLSFTLPQKLNNQQVSVSIYNALGQQVIHLFDGHLTSGVHLIGWDGQSKSGNLVASGLYLVQLQVANEMVIEKVLLSR